MSKVEKIKEKYRDLNGSREFLLYGEITNTNIGSVTKGSIFIFSNFWLQIKGVLRVFFVKNYILETDKQIIVLKRIKNNGSIVNSNKHIMVNLQDLSNVLIKRVTIGNDYRLMFTNKKGEALEFELNIRNQRDDLKRFREYIRLINNNLNTLENK